jgi:hypothetical protein
VVSHYDVQRVIDICATSQGWDLGGVAADVRKVTDEFQSSLPHGSYMVERGQVETMHSMVLSLV